MFRISFLILFLYIGTLGLAQAQRGSKIKYKAEKLMNAKVDDVKCKKLIDRVVFKQNRTIVYCDSAYFFSDENKMEAYGRVRIKDGDSVTITAKKLIYLGDESMALLRDDVVYRKGLKVLYTDFLDYNLETEVAEFMNNGKLVDEHNTLTSNYGRYLSRSSYAYFYKKVVLVSPDFNLKADTLEYNSLTQIAYTKGPTYIENKDGTTVDADGGTFKTKVDQTTFKDGTIETRNYILVGDDIFIDEMKRYYTAKGHVIMTSKKDDIIIFGDEAVYDKQEGFSKVYGNPLMKRVLKEDTLFLSADTLVSIENVDKDKERILAFHNNLMYMKNMQGRSDSMAYFLADSTIRMYNDPVLWNKNNQMVADSIHLIFKNEVLYKMAMRRSAFLSSLDTMGQFNQIKGRNMLGHFDENGDISIMDVNGNGESHYFVLEGDSLFLGMNKILCSNMKINFLENKMQNITFYKDPEAQFIPPHELTESQQLLEDFHWRITERPKKYHVATYYAKPDAEPLVKSEKTIFEKRPKKGVNKPSPKDTKSNRQPSGFK